MRTDLEQLHAQINRMAEDMCRLSCRPASGPSQWRPAVNAYRLADEFLICLDLAGLDKSQISVRAEPHRLQISGQRTAPEPPPSANTPRQVLALEIDSGHFERSLSLPEAVDAERVRATYRDGLLWINLPLARTTITVTPQDQTP